MANFFVKILLYLEKILIYMESFLSTFFYLVFYLKNFNWMTKKVMTFSNFKILPTGNQFLITAPTPIQALTCNMALLLMLPVKSNVWTKGWLKAWKIDTDVNLCLKFCRVSESEDNELRETVKKLILKMLATAV